MINYFKAAVCALLLALACLVVSPPPVAQAATQGSKHDCWYDDGGWFYADHSVCLWVDYELQGDGVGINVTAVTLTCYGSYESDMAVNGHGLKVIRSGGIVKKQWSDADSNIGGNCYRLYDADIHMPDANSVTVAYNFTARFNNQPNNDGSIAFTFYNNL